VSLLGDGCCHDLRMLGRYLRFASLTTLVSGLVKSAIHQSPEITGQPVPKGEEIASLSYNYVFRVMTPTGTFQPVALSSIVKHLYLVKEVRLTQQALKTLARKTLPEQSEDDYV
jgi:hypothetical protein